tara:strand:+ start:278 stop:538 length:261 start_codon:yes stop_codon:yes gene_type:complete
LFQYDFCVGASELGGSSVNDDLLLGRKFLVRNIIIIGMILFVIAGGACFVWLFINLLVGLLVFFRGCSWCWLVLFLLFLREIVVVI